MQRVANLAWAALIFNVVVILGGALVRATGSGAGCGNSWPTCEGQIVPTQIEGALAIEFAHRVFSGVALLVVGLLFATVRRSTSPRGSMHHRQLRRAAAWSMIAIIGEALIGAGIVLFEWVNEDNSIARTVAVPLHLINTLLLVAALALVVSLASWGRPLEWSRRPGTRGVVWGLGLMLLVAATGAITALADTLFPKESVSFAQLSGTETFLTSLRIFHPAIAVAAGIVIFRIVLARPTGSSERAARFAGVVMRLVVAQLVVGIVNVLLLVPVWMQLVHLALADALWIMFVWYAAEIQARDPAAVPTG